MIKNENKVITQKFNNRSKILQTIGNNKIARKDLAKLVKLTPAAITILTNEMIKEGIIVETGEQAVTNKVGRKKTFIKINKNYKYIFGVAIETDSITISVSNIYKDIIDTVSYQYNSPSWEDVKQMIYKEINHFQQIHNLSKRQILGLGVGIVGFVNSIEGTSIQAIGLWNTVIDIKSELEELLGISVVLDNNVRVLALAEMDHRDYNNNLVFIKYGPGIGASMIVNGEIYRGTTFTSLELGHTLIKDNNKPCYCGQIGCLETIGSYSSIKEDLLMHYDKTTLLKDITKNNRNNIHTDTIIEAYHSKDPYVVKTITKALEHFTLSLFNLMKIVDIKECIFSGRFFSDNSMFSLLKKQMAFHGKNYSNKLKQSVLDNNKSIGGISLARKELFYDTGANEGSTK